MSFNVGELVAYLRLDLDQFDAGIADAQRKADKLDGKDVDVKVKADTSGADAKLTATEAKMAEVAAAESKVALSAKTASGGLDKVSTSARKVADATARAGIAQLRLDELQKSGTAKASALASAQQSLVRAQRDLAAAMKEVDSGNKKIAHSGAQAGQGMSALVSAAILLGPALVPIAAGAAGLAAGWSAMGAAGVLAIVGIREQMAAGTQMGIQYTDLMGTLTDDLHTLAATAAGGVLGPFQQEVASLQGSMPFLNGMIGEFSNVTGKAASALVSGLVAAFIALEPLERDVAGYTLTLSERFDALMSGGGVVSFGDYVRSVFPVVMQDVESLVGAAVHLVEAIAPLGMGSLGILRMLSDLINALPVNVLATLVQVASSAYVAFSAFKLLSGPLSGLSTTLRGVGLSAEAAATGVKALTIASGVIGAVLGVATLAYSVFADSQRRSTQFANDFADAIRQDNGVLGENTQAMAVKQLQDSGALDLARQMHIAYGDVTAAVLGQAGAQSKLNAEIDSYVKNAGTQSVLVDGQVVQQQKGTVEADKLRQVTSDLAAATANGAASNRQLTDATAATTASMTPAQQAQADLAAKFGVTAAALASATTAQQTTAQAAQDATAKMLLENDAAGILKASLDILNGKSLSLMQAQTADAAATNNATDSLKKNGTAIQGNSAAAIANQQALQQKALASQAEAEAVGKATGSTDKAVQAYKDSKTALENATRAQGLLTPAVQAYINKLYDVNNLKVKPTKLDVDTASALQKIRDLQSWINGMHGKTVQINTIQQTIAYTTSGGNNVASVGGAPVKRAAGGWALGAGTSTSDSIDARLSNGEFVVNAAAAARNRALLESINSGRAGGSGSGGPLDLSDSTITRLAGAMMRAAQTGTDAAMSPITEMLTGLPVAARQGVAL